MEQFDRKAFEQELAQMKREHEWISLKFDLFCIELVWKDMLKRAGYNPNQPRVPAGNSDGGQWTGGGGGVSKKPIANEKPVSGGGTQDKEPTSPFVDPAKHPVDDPPIQESYLIENIVAIVTGARLIVGAGEVIAGAVIVGRNVAVKATEHGSVRLAQRVISNKEALKAMKSAEKSGNVTTKIGKYGTSQNVYKGSNGVTVVIESSGRNAGKIITTYRHK